ncbi:nucleotidyltransferase family protein [Microvirga flavescens]|uniref:nucleotidyltransferase family protein n=1 Tax=Microvirga flavescens TaxID=2249811 RepID=UPI001FDEFCDB|nr:nucleotidyltransferase family protein [Microvirga flavescens]
MAITNEEAEAFREAILQNPINRLLLERLPRLGLEDVWLVGGCLFQTVWNVQTGRAPTDGIQDYDVFYFSGVDLSWEAEHHDILRAAEIVKDIPARVELRNQARVHLWYGERFGPGYPQLWSSREGIDRFLISCARVAVGVGEQNALDLYAPCGLADLYAGVLRPNPLNFRPDLFAAKSQSYKTRWPWLKVESSVFTAA